MILRRTMVSTAAGLAVSLSACAPEAGSAQGRDISDLYGIFLIAAAVVFVVTAGLIAWSLIRYRDRGERGLPPQFHSNLKLELVWFAIPQVTVIALFVLSSMTLGKVNEQKAEPDVTVSVTGYQWGWRFDVAHEDKSVRVESSPDDPAEVVLPTGDIAFLLTSADVVHAFYVPRFLTKRDVIPGRDTRIDVRIEEPGTYEGVCAEFCGLFHHRMGFSIEAVSPDEFEAWVDANGEDA